MEKKWIPKPRKFVTATAKEHKYIDPPSAPEMAKNLVSALGSAALSGFQKVSDEKQQERLDLCKACEYYQAKDARCMKCGCFLKFKSMFEAWHCPIGKW